ncbi:MAG TPA: hypothetical protein VGO93_20470 [Candidatus Xenobia bacterium]|jgi:hypothetical protein
MPSIADLGPLTPALVDELLRAPRTRHTVSHPCGTILAECSAVFEGQLVQFVEGLRNIEELQDGFRVQFGWSHVVLRQNGETYRVEEPDFNGDPYQGMRPDVTLTLLIAAWQAMVCRRVGAVGPDVTWEDDLVMAGDALGEDRVFMKREAPTESTPSLWYLGAVREAKARLQPSMVRGYQVWQRRPCLVTVLCLPPEYLCVFEGDKLHGIADPHNQEVWA